MRRRSTATALSSCAPTGVAMDELTRADTRERYLAECAEHVRALTGARVAIPFDYVLRTGAAFGAEEFEKRGTYCCCRPHGDHTFESATRRIRDLLPSPYDAMFARGRHAICNAWRRWDGGNAWPLACAAYDTVDFDNDLVECELIYKHRKGHTFNISSDAKIEYHFFENMDKDDLLVFKIADTEHAKGCIHTGIDNKNAPSDDPPRVSVEARFILLWDEEVADGLAAEGAHNGGVHLSHNQVSRRLRRARAGRQVVAVARAQRVEARPTRSVEHGAAPRAERRRAPQRTAREDAMAPRAYPRRSAQALQGARGVLGREGPYPLVGHARQRLDPCARVARDARVEHGRDAHQRDGVRVVRRGEQRGAAARPSDGDVPRVGVSNRVPVQRALDVVG